MRFTASSGAWGSMKARRPMVPRPRFRFWRVLSWMFDSFEQLLEFIVAQSPAVAGSSFVPKRRRSW